MALRTADDGARSAMLAGGAAAVAVLAACAEQSAPAPPGRTARLPDEGFFVGDNPDEGLKLVYGRDGTDDVRLMLECRPGSRTIQIIDAGHPGAHRGQPLILTSDGVRSTLPATIEADETAEDPEVIAHAAPDLPALAGFRRSGVIGVKLGSGEYTLSATASEKAEIAHFFSGCERK